MRLMGGLVLGALALLTSQRVDVWHDDGRLWADAALHAPAKPRPFINLACAEIRAKQFDAADWHLQHAQALTTDRVGESPVIAWEVLHDRDLAQANLAVLRLAQGRRLDAAHLLADASMGTAEMTVARQYGIVYGVNYHKLYDLTNEDH